MGGKRAAACLAFLKAFKTQKIEQYRSSNRAAQLRQAVINTSIVWRK
jgi:hypothetical protein